MQLSRNRQGGPAAALGALLGIERSPVSHAEKLVSAAGGCLAIFAIYAVSRASLDETGAAMLVASMGASAVLLFAVPHGQLSQPWAVLGGHGVSALVGVTCAMLVPSPLFSAALAVGLAIGLMYYLRCLHPPGGATALTAVIGGEATQALGYQFVLTPVMLNVAIILFVAVAYNALFAWRRYPVALRERPGGELPETAGGEHYGPISHADFVYALSQIDSYVDVAESDLLRIYEIATGRARGEALTPGVIRLGACYSNGEADDRLAVRQVIDESPGGEGEHDQVIYKVLLGEGQYSTGIMTRAAFARWARARVVASGEGWTSVTLDGTPPGQ